MKKEFTLASVNVRYKLGYEEVIPLRRLIIRFFPRDISVQILVNATVKRSKGHSSVRLSSFLSCHAADELMAPDSRGK